MLTILMVISVVFSLAEVPSSALLTAMVMDGATLLLGVWIGYKANQL